MRIPFDEISSRNLACLSRLAEFLRLARILRHNFKHERLALDGLFLHSCGCLRPHSNRPAVIGIGDGGYSSNLPKFHGLKHEFVHEYRVSTKLF